MQPYKFIDQADLDTATAYRLLVGCVAPRPIAWITTLNGDGSVNCAPFSSYNYVCTTPPMLAINITERADRLKDTARNMRERGQFVVNVATEANMEVMHRCGADYAPDESEAAILGLDLLPSRRVAPPRIAISPVQMECRLDQFIKLGTGTNTLYIGEVLAFHLSEEVYDGQRVDTAKMRPLSRLGGPFYAGLGEIFHRPMLQRPPGGEGWVQQETGVKNNETQGDLKS